MARGYDPAVKRATAIGGEGAPPPAVAWDSLRDELRDGGGALGAAREGRVLLAAPRCVRVCVCARAQFRERSRASARIPVWQRAVTAPGPRRDYNGATMIEP